MAHWSTLVAQVTEENRIEVHCFSPLEKFTQLQRWVLSRLEGFCMGEEAELTYDPSRKRTKWVGFVIDMEQLERLGKRAQDYGIEFSIE